MELDWNVLHEYPPYLIAGAGTMLAITAVAAAIATVLVLALARISGRRVLSWPAYIYIEFFRTTPPLIQISGLTSSCRC